MKIATYLSSALFLLSANYLQAQNLPVESKSDQLPSVAKPQKNNQYTDQMIVKMQSASEYDHAKFIKNAQQVTGENFSYVRALGDGTGHVMKLDRMVSLEEMNRIAVIIKQIDSSIKYVKADARMFPMATTPNDEFFASRQWNLQSSATQGLNLPDAWDYTTGSSDVVVAVLDTGILKDHVGFDSARLLTGYDMVSANNVDGAFSKAGDTDGQDDNPNDEGDWVTSAENLDGSGEFFNCEVTDSTWHGTHVAGIIGAATNDGNGDGTGGGISGIDWNAKILPVRVLGKCGGYTSDIADGIRWAAGLSVTGIATDNLTPAKVINMSFGSVGVCDNDIQSAIDDARTAGSVVIVAAGNDSALASDSTPANCENVIVVAAHDQDGELSASSNKGSVVDVMAPGGTPATTCNDDAQEAIYSLGDGSETDAAIPDNSYICREGSSMAAAHVSGVASLMLAGNPNLTPDEIENSIKLSARSFVTDSSCDITADTCGSGIADAAAAVLTVAIPNTLSAIDVTSSQVGLSWADNSSFELGYQIERSDNNTPYKRLIIASPDENAYTDSSLIVDGTTYFYRVRMITVSGLNDAIEEIEVFTDISVPTYLTGRSSSSQINLSWVDNSATEDGVKIERSLDGVNYTQIASVAADVTSYDDTNILAESFYYYRVKAYQDLNNAESVYSSSAALSTSSSEKGAGGLHWYLILVLLFMVGRSTSIKFN